MAFSGYGYFQFSKEQLDSRTASEIRLGKIFYPGKVIVKGREKLFTQITKTSESKYNDAKILTQGNTNLMTYTEPYTD